MIQEENYLPTESVQAIDGENKNSKYLPIHRYDVNSSRIFKGVPMTVGYKTSLILPIAIQADTEGQAIREEVSNVTLSLLRQLCQSRRIIRFLDRICSERAIQVQVIANSGELVLTYGALKGNRDRSLSARAAVLHRGRQAATVVVTAFDEDAGSLAEWIGSFLNDMIELEDEVASLTGEVVHSYEELHLLYSLGGALGGVLDLVDACNLIVQSIAEPLNARRATLQLKQSAGGTRVSYQLDRGPDKECNPDARLSATLLVNGEEIGQIVLEGKIGANEFNSGDGKLLDGVAAVAAPAIRSAQLYQVARQQADTDGLTGLLNHRCFQERIETSIKTSQSSDKPLSIILADLDSFKLFNDTYGHQVGDQVLCTVSDCLVSTVRHQDLVGRYGGDEFIIMLPDTGVSGAADVAQRILANIKQCDIQVDGYSLPLRLSLGIATFPADAGSKHELIAHADAALYEAKGSGGGQARQALATKQDWAALHSSSYGALEGLVNTVDAKDHYTREHSEVVTDAALVLAGALRLSDETQRALRIAGLLHDIGKIGIPDQILKKPGKLTSDEYEVMKQHVQLSEMIIKNVPFVNDVLAAVGHHHERYDGKGYPYQKRGEDIPLLGRIMAVADAYSAMSMDRPYRRRMSWDEIRQELLSSAGSQLDPELVNIFVSAMEDEKSEKRRKKRSARVPTPYKTNGKHE